MEPQEKNSAKLSEQGIGCRWSSVKTGPTLQVGLDRTGRLQCSDAAAWGVAQKLAPARCAGHALEASPHMLPGEQY